MKIIYWVKYLFICLILLTGCQNQRVVEIREFYSLGPETFSIISVVKDEDWLAETRRLSEFYNDNVLKISVLGALKASSSEVKNLIEEYDVKNYPTYFLFDSEKLLLKETDYEKFRTESKVLMD
ncbi:hypothetical protein OIN60_03385 [Paenibacillus sp. P96]|uniref:Uncharacterized protein n=1 Tax=Paenibacillus zeirhizosphaerae TaxID=2987519 RepID=A0ABT9FM96_9BACL|nr:hypothetical protein [Paenibacillus sp. P96]MDP4095833.1 hypothetical protein [Paenibacillus sp. P96]